ncbi:MAG: hypothetical protein AB7T06_27865 [Kofleriaceae bacterium]
MLRAMVDPTWVLALLPLAILLNTILSASLTYGVVMELYGTRPSLRACISNGVAQLIPVIGVVALSSLGIGAGLLLIVPGIVFALNWYVVVPVAIIERLGVMDSLRRSRELTHDHRGQLFAIVVVTWLVTFALTYVGQQMLDGLALLLASAVWSAMCGSLFAVVTAVAYTTLRQVKEGTRVPEIATAFARFTR